jgi:hypothetical protein
MVLCSCRKVLLLTVLFLSVILFQGIGSPAMAQPDTISVRLRGSMELDFLPFMVDSADVLFDGRAKIIWNEIFPNRIESEIDTCRLHNWRGVWMHEDPLIPSIGTAYLPDHDPWIESFFDIYLEIQVPQYPGETLKMYIPLHLQGMANGWPAYFGSYSMMMGMAPVPLYIDGVESGHILSCELEMLPYYEPEVQVSVPTAYGSEVAEVDEEGYIAVCAAVTGEYKATEAVFSYRLCGDPGPFTVFYVDTDGSAPHVPTIDPSVSGDGWTGYFDPGSDPFEGQCVQFEAALFVPSLGMLVDTVEAWVDGTPPIPTFHDISSDSIPDYDVDSFFDVTFRLDDELPSPGTSELLLYPLQLRCERTHPPVNQYDLGTALDAVSCAPSAAASIVKYFAENGYPELDHPEGDTLRPEESVEDIARELQWTMGTDTSGTDEEVVWPATCFYVAAHGRWEWLYNFKEVYNASNMAEMFREFDSDSEEVMLCISDSTSSGGEVYYTTTLEFVDVNSDPMTIGFVDPVDGDLQDYPLDFSGSGPPTIVGYDVPGCSGGNAKLCGYIKISPTWVPDDDSFRSQRPLKAPLRAPWVVVDSGIATGNGVVDTLHLDTSPFPPGWYLMEVVTVDDQGFQCRDIRLAVIGSVTGVDDSAGPGLKTMLRGSYPNPFNPWTTIEYSLERDANVTLVIFDVAGRKVRTLLSGAKTEAGIHKVNWDGTNDNGMKLVSGVYFASYVAEGRVSSKKLILLR